MTIGGLRGAALAGLLAVASSCGGGRSAQDALTSGDVAQKDAQKDAEKNAEEDADGDAGSVDAGSEETPGSGPTCNVEPRSTAEAGVAVADPGTEGDGDFTIGPTYADAPELLGRPGVPRGALKTFTMSSTVSAIFPGITGPYVRSVTVYLPSQYVPGTEAPFMVVQDGSSFVATLPSVLDNLINDGRLPVMVAILINPGPGDGPGSERGLEYDTLSGDYVDFIETEVLPRVQRDYAVTLTGDPEGRAAMGWSSGGAAAFTMGWWCPHLYHRILTYSGTFVNQHPDADHPHGAWEYHEHLIAESDPRPLRVFLEVGDADIGAADPESTYHNWVLANQRMAAALGARGYHYRFVLATNAGHTSTKVLGQTLPETLMWLWRGYPVRQ